MGNVARGHDDEGISLIEVLAGVMILGVVMAALAATSLSALASSRVAQDQVNAAQLISEVVEDLLTRPFAQLAPATHDGVVSPAYAPTTRRGVVYTAATAVRWVDDACNGQGQAPVAGAADARRDYLRLAVTVSWTAGGTPRSIQTVMLRAPAHGEHRVARGAGC